ncbi:MAG: binding-protein-dependent transport system inner rane component, partial [candidate division NC10 bacterium]|nr:binding-protein-dependent transport system inner rane component [candidate division NC10 bacterium]
MSERPTPTGGIAASIRRLRTARPSERREWLFALALLTPACVMLAVFVAYPFCRGIWLSFSDTLIGREGAFVGLSNFARLWQDSIFQRTTQNTFIYTAIATLLKLALGMAVALMLNMLIGF